ncbi:type II toxin-antitoxin system HicB family antitoxin [Candidatus Curtissbacteria bacterium]|nr:type II toxin-antitoxin system HicB family antitoxin [Candidatus Curtissbacteria bacterium]
MERDKRPDIHLFPIEITTQEDGLYRVFCPEMQGCWVDSPTLEEALRDIQEVIKLSVRSRVKHQEPWPQRETTLPIRVDLPVEIEMN